MCRHGPVRRPGVSQPRHLLGAGAELQAGHLADGLHRPGGGAEGGVRQGGHSEDCDTHELPLASVCSVLLSIFPCIYVLRCEMYSRDYWLGGDWSKHRSVNMIILFTSLIYMKSFQ